MEGPKQPRAREIEDSFLDEYLIARFSDGLSKVLLPKGGEGGEGTKSDDTNFKRDVGEKCVRIVRDSASAEEQRAKGLRVIDAFFPEPIPPLFGRFLKLFPGWFARRHAAVVTPLVLQWMVGKAEVNDVPDEYELDEEEDVPANAFDAVCRRDEKVSAGYKQGVLIERCRVLEESGCVQVCQNVCKVPTEKFFGERVGLPVTLIPNYEDFSCQMVYGRKPRGDEGEEATGCLMGCKASKDSQKCCDNG